MTYEKFKAYHQRAAARLARMDRHAVTWQPLLGIALSVSGIRHRLFWKAGVVYESDTRDYMAKGRRRLETRYDLDAVLTFDQTTGLNLTEDLDFLLDPTAT